MPKTRVHDATACALSATFTTLAVVTGFTPLIVLGAGSLLGLIYSPDLDWDGYVVEDITTGRRYTITERRPRHYEKKIRFAWSRVARRWPPGLRHLWFLYAKVAGHRGNSHSWYGTIVRLVFTLPLVVLVTILLWKLIGPYSMLLWVGLWISDISHIALDRL